MFGGGEGPSDESWRGWWGDEPPFHALENVGDPTLDPVKVVASPAVTHVKYRVVRRHAAAASPAA